MTSVMGRRRVLSALLSLCLLISMSGTAARADEVPSCLMDQDEVGALDESEASAIFLLASDRGAFGLSCDSVKTLVGEFQFLEASLLPAYVVASRNPRLAALIDRGLDLVVKDPYVLALVVGGVIGTRTIYFNLNKSKEECERASEREKLELMIERQLHINPARPVPIRFK